MTQFIDKDAVIAEIKRRIKTNKECMLGLKNLDYYQGKVDALNDTISFLDAIKVKEIDLEEEIYNFWDKNYMKIEGSVKDIKLIGEHFFELGIKAKDK